MTSSVALKCTKSRSMLYDLASMSFLPQTWHCRLPTSGQDTTSFALSLVSGGSNSPRSVEVVAACTQSRRSQTSRHSSQAVRIEVTKPWCQPWPGASLLRRCCYKQLTYCALGLNVCPVVLLLPSAGLSSLLAVITWMISVPAVRCTAVAKSIQGTAGCCAPATQVSRAISAR